MTKKTQCPLCGEFEVLRQTKAVTHTFKGHKLEVMQPGEYCSACGESILSPADLKATAKEIEQWRSEISGRLTPQDVKRIRNGLKLNQKEAGAIFGGGPNAFSRYENGLARIPKAVEFLFKMLDQYPNETTVRAVSSVINLSCLTFQSKKVKQANG
ncbi:type II toxin-antitoxin system MqsA family antitoxin [Piscirickettsia salmonis]|uniref:type II toxin-antitoxin system MqsA family antitoxin n=1 Tax=Piscirickettsia salmonis TaxID=1238 RepID=UPI003EC0FDC6